MRILCPCRLDTYSPISRIHQNVARELTHEFYGFSGEGQGPKLDDEGITTIRLEGNDLWKAYRYLRQYGAGHDIIHTGPFWHVPIALLSRPLSSGAVVHTFHGIGERTNSLTPRVRRRRRLMTRYSDRITAVSQYVAQGIEETYGRRPEVIPNGVDIEWFHPDRTETVPDRYLFVARFNDRKHPLLVTKLARAMPESSFVMVGLGPLSEQVNTCEGELDNLEVYSNVSDERLADLYAGASATLCPFENEGFGMVIVESMSSGTPVVGLADGNLPNLIGPGNGRLCETLEVDEWASALRETSESLNRFDARSSARRYAWENIARRYDEVYRTVAE